MARLLVHVEGQTEETFVNEVLAPFLRDKGFIAVSARIVGNARQRERRGGIKPWPSVKKDILRHLRQDPKCLATTMVDFYGMPAEPPHAWPGRAVPRTLTARQKATSVEEALQQDLACESPEAGLRFIPFVVVHEFEGLLFSDCSAFSRGIGRPLLAQDLQQIRDKFTTPEDIKDSSLTAPSKRIEALLPGYEKPLLGNLAALEIGIEAIRRECPNP